MQNTVTELSHRLLRSLDNNYNVIDMPAVVEIISALERTSITEELLKTTRLGKYVNELRRKTSNEALARRAKELLKKWRDQVLPSHPPHSSTVANGTNSGGGSVLKVTSKNNDCSNSSDANLNRVINNKKRPLSSLAIDESNNRNKRIKMNGRHLLSEQMFSSPDNSNSSISVKSRNQKNIVTHLITINSDSNNSSSFHGAGNEERVPSINDTNLTFSGRNLSSIVIKNESHQQQRTPTPTSQQPPPPSITITATPVLAQTTKPEPKKRGRKKGSKNHKTLLDQAEESFTNKMAVSVNAKVKTTQELLASIQNKTLNSPNSMTIRAEKVVSPKINSILPSSSAKQTVSSPKITFENVVKNNNLLTSSTSSTKLTDKLKKDLFRTNSPTIKIDLDSENSRSSFQDSLPSVVTIKECSDEDGSDIIEVEHVVKEEEGEKEEKPLEDQVKVEEEECKLDESVQEVKTVEDILAKLPKVDYSCLNDVDPDEPVCTCVIPEPKPVVDSFVNNITVEIEHKTNSIFDVPDYDERSELRTQTADEKDVSVSQPSLAKEIANEESTAADDEKDCDCPAKRYLEEKYHLGDEFISDSRVNELHTRYLDSVNGNKCEKTVNKVSCDDGLYTNIVPNFHNGEYIKKDITLESINYIKYKKILPYPYQITDERTNCDQSEEEQILLCSEQQDVSVSNLRSPESKNQFKTNTDDSGVSGDDCQLLTHENFREFHECVSLRSYNDELLHILPYVVLD